MSVLPERQACPHCGHFWFGNHYCPVLNEGKLPTDAAPKQLTEEDVRRIVLEELASHEAFHHGEQP